MSTAAMSDSRRAAAWSPALRSMGLQCNLVTPNVNGKHIFSCAGEAERTARAAHDDRLAASLHSYPVRRPAPADRAWS